MKGKSGFVIALFFAAVALAYTLPIFKNFHYWGIQDWDQHFFYSGVARASLLDYHQFPLWNPYHCGGTVATANPQSRTLLPTFLLTLVLGEVKGIKVDIWLHLIFGMLGMYRLMRHYKLDGSSALLASFVFMLNSMYALNGTVGMPWFLTSAYIPWAFLYYLKALDHWRYAFICGIFLTLMLFGGGIYILCITLLFLFCYSVFLILFRERKLLRVLQVGVILCVYTACLSAVKLVPCFEFMHTYPRVIHDYSGHSLQSLVYSLLHRDQTLPMNLGLSHEKGFRGGFSYEIADNGMYVGLVPILLFFAGLASFRRQRPLVLCLTLFLWLSFGDRAPFSLWGLLHRFHFFDSMRVAQRFQVIVILCLAIFAGFGLRSVKDFIFKRPDRQRLKEFFGRAVVVLVLIDLTAVGYPIWKDAFIIPPPAIQRSRHFMQFPALPTFDRNGVVNQREGYYNYDSAWGALYPAFLSNIGTVFARESANCPRNAFPFTSPLYAGEVYFMETRGNAFFTDWSPNRLKVSVASEGTGYLILNQNCYAGWRAKVDGKKVDTHWIRGSLGVKISPSDKEVELYYLPASAIVGSLVTLLTLIASVFLIRPLLTAKSAAGPERVLVAEEA